MERHFPYLEEGTIETILRIALKSGGLYLAPLEEPVMLAAYWRFWPERWEEVRDDPLGMDGDLSRGPCLYVAAFITPLGVDGYRLFREMVEILNPYLVTAHRHESGEWRFTCRKNRHFDREKWSRENGQLQQEERH